MTKSETITVASTSQTRGNGRGSQTEQNMIPVDTATPDEDPLCIVGMG